MPTSFCHHLSPHPTVAYSSSDDHQALLSPTPSSLRNSELEHQTEQAIISALLTPFLNSRPANEVTGSASGDNRGHSALQTLYIDG
jgi:hypothetical protein